MGNDTVAARKPSNIFPSFFSPEVGGPLPIFFVGSLAYWDPAGDILGLCNLQKRTRTKTISRHVLRQRKALFNCLRLSLGTEKHLRRQVSCLVMYVSTFLV